MALNVSRNAVRLCSGFLRIPGVWCTIPFVFLRVITFPHLKFPQHFSETLSLNSIMPWLAKVGKTGHPQQLRKTAHTRIIMIGRRGYIGPTAPRWKKDKYKKEQPGCEIKRPPSALGLSPISLHPILQKTKTPRCSCLPLYATGSYAVDVVTYWRTMVLPCAHGVTHLSFYFTSPVLHKHAGHACSLSIQQS